MGDQARLGLRTEHRKRNEAGRKWVIKQDAAYEQSIESGMRQAANARICVLRPPDCKKSI